MAEKNRNKKNVGVDDQPEEVPLRVELGARIQNIRRRRGLSQEAVAERIGASRTTISKIENGVFAPTVDYLEKLSKVCGFWVRIVEKTERFD